MEIKAKLKLKKELQKIVEASENIREVMQGCPQTNNVSSIELFGNKEKVTYLIGKNEMILAEYGNKNRGYYSISVTKGELN